MPSLRSSFSRSSIAAIGFVLTFAPHLANAAASHRDGRLVGTWSTDQGPGGVAGTLHLGKSGRVSLQPAGFPPVIGTWSVQRGMLVMAVPNMGESAAGFHLENSNQVLSLDYPDGSHQVFTRAADTPQPQPMQKKEQ